MKKIIQLVLIFSFISSASATEQYRPKIGLVLSGGGARGAAHIGVIQALEEMNVPIDMIVGTSMGAVIGGLYASGVPINKIEYDFSAINWEQIFSLNIDRDYLYYRRKLDSTLFLIKNFISYSNGQLHIPFGIITGQSLYEVFNSYVLSGQPITDFNDLKIPFKAVSTDLITGKAVILEKGDFALALLASMAVPGIISPVEMNQYLLVDGGVSANLPIEIARSMGADIVIVVDVSTPLSTKTQIIDLTGVLGQLTNILTHKNIVESEKHLTPSDVLLKPVIKNLETSEFDKFSQGIEPGKKIAYSQEQKLRKLSASPSESHVMVPYTNDEPFAIEAVMVKNEKTICPQTYFHYLDFDSEIVTPEEIKEHIDYLYGLSVFDRIYYGIENTPEGKQLVVEPKVNTSQPLYIQSSLLLDTDFETTNTFGFVVGITNQQVNSLLGEWRVVAQIGQGEGLLGEFYQPLTTDLSWFINPVLAIQRTPSTLYYDYNPIATYLTTTNHAAFSFGKIFSNVARLRGFWQFDNNDFKRKVGSDELFQGHISDGQVGLSLELDSVDNVFFPHQGIKGHITLSSFGKAYGGETNFSQLNVRGFGAASLGKHSLLLGGRYNRTLENIPSFPARFSLGGLFELTGLSSNEIYGNNSALLSGIYFYEFKKIHIIPNRPTPVYLGGSLESGKVWQGTNLSDNSFIESGSLFIGVDSLLGPAYLAVGITDTGRKAIHLMLRPAFK